MRRIRDRVISQVSQHIRRWIILGTIVFLVVSCTGSTGTPQPTGTIPQAIFTQTALVTPMQPGTTTQAQVASATPGLKHTPQSTPSAKAASLKTVFLIVMENHDWSDIYNESAAPYINNTLLPQASYAKQYVNVPGNHPSLPNYLWLEAGTNFGIKNDNGTGSNHQSSTDHLVTLLNRAGISWKAYEEGISGNECPLSDSNLYAARHNPMVYFDDVTENNNPNSAYCIAHERPFSELQSDLEKNSVAQYNFITPDLCNDMHNSTGCQTLDDVKNGDTWLSQQVPMILASKAYQQGGVIFITWDESENGDHPIGMIVLSSLAKGGGYSNTIHYTHSSTLRTIQEIFNVTPFLGDAANATDLSDLFSKFP